MFLKDLEFDEFDSENISELISKGAIELTDWRESSAIVKTPAAKPQGIMSDETTGTGAIPWSVFSYYLSASGGYTFGPVFVVLMTWSAVSW